MSIPRSKHPTRQRIANELQKGVPLSKYDLEERCFLSKRSVNEYLKIMHESGEIHIAAYHQLTGHGTPTRYWLYGSGVDAKYPKPKTQAQKAKEYRARYPERCIELMLEKRRMRREVANEYNYRTVPRCSNGG